MAAIVASGRRAAALYVLLMYQRIITGPRRGAWPVPDPASREKCVVAPLSVAVVSSASTPPALDVLTPAGVTLQFVGVSGPARHRHCGEGSD